MLLYRYIPVKYFKDMIEKEQLCFVNPLTEWEDKKEGLIHRNPLFISKVRKVIEKLQVISNNEYLEKFIKQLEIGWYKSFENELGDKKDDFFNMRCQSWSYMGNTKSMWREYCNKGSSVCMSIEYNDLKKLCGDIETMEVEYGDWEDVKFLENVVDKCYKKNSGEFDFPRVLKFKSYEFTFEHEQRLYVSSKDECCRKCNLVYKKVQGISNYIKDVYFSPCTSEEFQSEVISYCKQKGLKCCFHENL